MSLRRTSSNTVAKEALGIVKQEQKASGSIMNLSPRLIDSREWPWAVPDVCSQKSAFDAGSELCDLGHGF